MPFIFSAQHTEQIALFDALWYLADIAMSRCWRILATVLVLAALMPNAFGRPNIVCVESSGRISYSCNDLIPDEVSVRLALPISLGVSSQDCGFCHDYTVGQTVTQSFQSLALPPALIAAHRLVLPQRVSMLQPQSFTVSFVDTSGSISVLMC